MGGPSQPWAGGLELCKKQAEKATGSKLVRLVPLWSLPWFPPPSSRLDTLNDVLELASQRNPLFAQAALGQYFTPTTEKQPSVPFYEDTIF